MAALETFYNCRSFGNSVSNNIYQFTDVNTLIPIDQNDCAVHYDNLVAGATYIVGSEFLSISIGALFLWVWMAIIGMNHGLKNQRFEN